MRLLLVAVLVLTGCTSQEPPPPASVEGESVGASAVPCAPPSPLAVAPDPLPPVALPPRTVLTDVTQLGGQRLVTGRVDAPVSEVLMHFRADPGFVVTRDEDEGRSGRLQLFGAAGDVSVTVVRLACPRGLTGFTLSVPVTQPSPPG